MHPKAMDEDLKRLLNDTALETSLLQFLQGAYFSSECWGALFPSNAGRFVAPLSRAQDRRLLLAYYAATKLLRGRMAAFVTVLMMAAWLTAMVGGIMITVAAFRVSTKWGLIYLFVPFAAVYFWFHYWEETKPGMKVAACGWAVMLLVLALAFATAEKKPPQAMAEAKLPAPVKREAKLLSSITFDEGTSYAAPVPEPLEEEKAAPIIEQVYADNGSRMYWTSDCQSRPENAFRISKTLALTQRYTAATCADPIKPKKKKRR